MDLFKTVLNAVISYLNINLSVFGYSFSLFSVIIAFGLLGILWRAFFRLYK